MTIKIYLILSYLLKCVLNFYLQVLWLSLLLIGSIICAHPKQGTIGGQPMWWQVVSSSEQDPSQAVDQSPSGQVGSGSYGNSDSVFTHGTQQVALNDSSPYQCAEESWSSSSGTPGEDEPVFTPVDDEDQPYKSKSRSNRKQLRFLQFRYPPTEPFLLSVFLVWPPSLFLHQMSGASKG
uniref:Uncharacterized protein n=1 Tax=Xiphophorus maculatus TaxID=8083 RepID=A0A3B5Q1C6_XIPMA